MFDSLTGLGMQIGVAAAAAVFVAVAGALLTDIGPWYRAMKQPRWQPPDWAFGPAWTTIFTLAAAAGVIGWERAPDDASRAWLVWLFAANGLLNILWSFLYFRLRRPDWALAETFLLWGSVLLLIIELWPHARTAAWLLVPYLLWVMFAGALNLAIVRLNRPFSGRSG
jgi:translocator protein